MILVFHSFFSIQGSMTLQICFTIFFNHNKLVHIIGRKKIKKKKKKKKKTQFKQVLNWKKVLNVCCMNPSFCLHGSISSPSVNSLPASHSDILVYTCRNKKCVKRGLSFSRTSNILFAFRGSANVNFQEKGVWFFFGGGGFVWLGFFWFCFNFYF